MATEDETGQKSVGKTFMKLFWTSDDDKSEDSGNGAAEKPAAKSAPPARVPARPVITGVVSASPSLTVTATAQPDPEIRAKFEKAALSDGDNSVGLFLTAMANLAEDIPDPTARAKVVFKTQNLTPTAVLKDIASDEAIMATKEREFRAYVQAERQKAVAATKAEIEAARRSIQEKQQQMAALQAEISQLESRQGTLQTETAAKERQFADAEARFDATLSAFRSDRAALKSQVQPLATATK